MSATKLQSPTIPNWTDIQIEFETRIPSDNCSVWLNSCKHVYASKVSISDSKNRPESYKGKISRPSRSGHRLLQMMYLLVKCLFWGYLYTSWSSARVWGEWNKFNILHIIPYVFDWWVNQQIDFVFFKVLQSRVEKCIRENPKRR